MNNITLKDYRTIRDVLWAPLVFYLSQILNNTIQSQKVFKST